MPKRASPRFIDPAARASCARTLAKRSEGLRSAKILPCGGFRPKGVKTLHLPQMGGNQHKDPTMKTHDKFLASEAVHNAEKLKLWLRHAELFLDINPSTWSIVQVRVFHQYHTTAEMAIRTARLTRDASLFSIASQVSEEVSVLSRAVVLGPGHGLYTPTTYVTAILSSRCYCDKASRVSLQRNLADEIGEDSNCVSIFSQPYSTYSLENFLRSTITSDVWETSYEHKAVADAHAGRDWLPEQWVRVRGNAADGHDQLISCSPLARTH